jgi:hypothetical protein
MDETRFGRPRWLPDGVHDRPGEDGRVRWRRTDPWETGFVDITGDQALSLPSTAPITTVGGRIGRSDFSHGLIIPPRISATSGSGVGWSSEA